MRVARVSANVTARVDHSNRAKVLVFQRAAAGHFYQRCVLHGLIVEHIGPCACPVTRLTRAAFGVSHNPAMHQLRSPLQAQIVHWLVVPGDPIHQGDVLVILESMKMEHEVRAQADGRVVELLFAVGDLVNAGDLLLISERLTLDPRGLDGLRRPVRTSPLTGAPRRPVAGRGGW